MVQLPSSAGDAAAGGVARPLAGPACAICAPCDWCCDWRHEGSAAARSTSTSAVRKYSLLGRAIQRPCTSRGTNVPHRPRRSGPLNSHPPDKFQARNDQPPRGSIARSSRQFSNLHQLCELPLEEGVAQSVSTREILHGNDQKRWIEARLRGDGSGQAARDCEQGRESQSRWRPQGEFRPLTHSYLRARRTLGPGVRRLSVYAAATPEG